MIRRMKEQKKITKKVKHSRLKIEFMIAIFLSLLIGIFAVVLASFISENFLDARYSDQLVKYAKDIDAGMSKASYAINEGSMKASMIEQLEYEMNSGGAIKFSIYFREKDTDVIKFLDEVGGLTVQDAAVATRYFENEYGFFVVVAQSVTIVWTIGVILGIMVVIFLVSFLATFTLFVGRKQQYLTKIADGIDILTKGELGFKIEERGNDEITFVAKNINIMSRSLEEQIEKERLSENTKNELIANISHDLRTPLTSITGFLSLIDENEKIDEDTKNQYIKTALKKSIGLANLIEQLFEYVTLSNMKEDLNLIELDINQVCKHIIQEQSILLEEAGFSVEHDFTDQFYATTIDIERFSRVIDNLISNIIKHGDRKRVVIIEIGQLEEQFMLKISNSAKNLEKSMPDNIFSRFYTTDRNINGSAGLGLAIVKEIIHKHGGTVEAEVNNDRFIMTILIK